MNRSAFGPCIAALCMAASSAGAQTTVDWQDGHGAAVDVGSGGNTCIVSNIAYVYCLASGAWGRVGTLTGAVRIDVDPQGNPWVVDDRSDIHRWNGSAFVKLPGNAIDIGIGANGAVWVVGTDNRPYVWNGSNWEGRRGGGLLRIDVDANGNPWAVNVTGYIHRWTGNAWEGVAGGAQDVSIGGDDSVWIVGRDGLPWKFTGSDWRRYNGGGLLNVSVDRTGNPWATNTAQKVVRGVVPVARLVQPAAGPWKGLNLYWGFSETPGGGLANRGYAGLWLRPEHRERWFFEADGTVRAAAGRCLSSVGYADPCDGSAPQAGWSYRASDRTIRKSTHPRGCLVAFVSPIVGPDLPPSARLADECPLDSPAADPASKEASTWVLQ